MMMMMMREVKLGNGWIIFGKMKIQKGKRKGMHMITLYFRIGITTVSYVLY